jgi:hypothetical protein
MIYKAVTRPGRPERFGGGGGAGGEEHVDVLLDRLLRYGTTDAKKVEIPAPDKAITIGPDGKLTVSGLLSSPFVGGGSANLGGILGGTSGPSPIPAAKSIIDQINQEHDDLFKTQREKDIEKYDQELKDLNSALENQLKSQQLSDQEKLAAQQQYNEAFAKLQQDRNKTLADADKKYEEQAGKLFDDLLSGKTKSFGKTLTHDIEEAALAPIKEIFEQLLGTTLGGIARSSRSVFGTGGLNLGGILGPLGGLGGGLGGKIGPGGTAGWWPGQVGGGVSGAAGTPSVGVSAGQVGVATPVMNVHADIVNISGSLALPGQGPLGSTTGNFFGNLNPFSSNALGGPIGLAGIGGLTTGGGLGGALSSVGPYIASGALIGAGIASNNPTAMALGAASLAQAGIKSLTQFGGAISSTSGLGQALGKVSPALPGIALFAGGVAQGGLGGTLEATAGGALAGSSIGGMVAGPLGAGIGAAIGAGVGLVSGIVSTLIQGPSFAQRVRQAQRRQEYTLPPSETFSFAMGNSISQTLSTGFNQSGSNFGTYGLPAGTPFSATPITGYLTRQQQRQLLEEQMGLLSNQPFLGFPNKDPFTTSGSPSRRIGPIGGQGDGGVHFHITALDSKGVADFLNDHGESISRFVASRGVYSSSSGFASSARRAVNLP